MSIVEEIDACRVCGGQDWLEVIDFGPQPLANALLDPGTADGPRFPLGVVVCRDCRLMTLRHVVDPEELFRYFVWVSSDSRQIAAHMQRIAESATRVARLRPDDLVVEMGSNIGTQLAVFAGRGQRIAGVDPARNLAAIAAERGIPTEAAFFAPPAARRIAAARGMARFVLGRQCFAHIPDVHTALDGVDTVLAADGVLAIEVPYLLDLLRETQFDTIYHEHVSYYSLHTLRTLFARHGLRVIDVERAAVHGGSIVVYAARATSDREPSGAVHELLATEQEQGLLGDDAYLRFADEARAIIARVGDSVRELVAEGRTVAAYGAPSKGSTLLTMCGLTADEVRYATDTTSFKQGKLLPGSRVPIIAPGTGPEPDIFLLLAWNYAEEILANERGFLERGGAFLVPVPDTELITADGGGPRREAA